MIKHKTNILLIGSIPPPYYGVSIINKTILDSLFSDHFNIKHFDISHHKQLYAVERINFRNIFITLRQIITLPSFISQFQPQIIYLPICQTIRGLFRDMLFIIIARFFHAKVLIHLHGSYLGELYDKANILGKYIIKLICNNILRVIVLDDSLINILKGLIPNNKIRVIQNGIPDLFPDNKYNRSMNKHVQILYLSALARVKGYNDLVNAIPMVINKEKDIKIVCAGYEWGNTKDAENTKKFIAYNGLLPYIEHMPPIFGIEKNNLFMTSDIFVLPSYKEGQPLVILDAMSAGLPIIATDVGAIKSMVVDGENGFIVDLGNPKQIANKILFLIENPKIRAQMGKKSRERYLKYYTKEKFINGMQHVFEEVLNA
jgi:glycosyltransferase involved in cell wall biosynthesis